MDKFNQEADMGYITQVVQAVANALVMSTEFPGQINAMKADLASLHNDLETTKGRNAELDALLHDTRRQRDEAEQALSQVKNELAIASNKVLGLEADLNKALSQITHATDDLTKVKAERDDYGMKQIEAEDRAKAAEAKLDKLREAMGLPKAEAPVALSKPEPEPMPTPNAPQAEPILLKRVYENDYGYYEQSKDKLEKWDQAQRRYYVEV